VAVVAGSGKARKCSKSGKVEPVLVPLDDQRQWYRYHRLFSDLLQREWPVHNEELTPALAGQKEPGFDIAYLRQRLV
jgi:hypothetical protein